MEVVAQCAEKNVKLLSEKKILQALNDDYSPEKLKEIYDKAKQVLS